VGDPERDVSLAGHYTRFRVADRLLLTGHSHQAWPDVAREGVLEAYDDAALAVDQKWARAEVRAERLRAGVRMLLDEPGAEVALGASAHELLVRFLSALPLRYRPRLVTTDSEFDSARRQLDRLPEIGVEVVRVPAAPVETLAERLAAVVDTRTAAVVVSSVLFESSRIVPGLAAVAEACERAGSELLVDAYHQLGVVPLSVAADGLRDAWVLGGGYKYLQLGEGNCFLRIPSHASGREPLVTGWFAHDGDRFAGSTYDPTSHYRAARVLDFFVEQGLTPRRLREISLRQRGLLAREFDALDLPDEILTRDRVTPAEAFGGFLSLVSPHAARLREALAERGVHADNRGQHLRLGPAPYLTDDQLTEAMGVLGEVAACLSRFR
jgi:kynureninase